MTTTLRTATTKTDDDDDNSDGDDQTDDDDDNSDGDGQTDDDDDNSDGDGEAEATPVPLFLGASASSGVAVSADYRLVFRFAPAAMTLTRRVKTTI